MNEKDLKQGKSGKTTADSDTEAVKDAAKVRKTKAKVAAVTSSRKTAGATKRKTDDTVLEKKEKKIATTKTKSAATARTTKKTAANVVDSVLVEKPKKVKRAVAKTKKRAETKVETSRGELPLSAKIQTQENFDLSETAPEDEKVSPVFKELADPKLPDLKEKNRAFLQMQSPTRLFFYWSLKHNADKILRQALGNRADDYFLAIRLTNLTTNKEEIHRVGSRGSWWFNSIEAGSKYRAEVGFYAQDRPFVRVIFSNTLETPRVSPSANVAYQPYFAVTSEEFAEVLYLAGYSQDAVEVNLSGDSPQQSDDATRKAFARLVEQQEFDFFNHAELRYVLFALALGTPLAAMRGQISGKLFEFLSNLTRETPDALNGQKAIGLLEEFFGFFPEFEDEGGAPNVFGASSVNFPRSKRPARFAPNPISSFSLK